MDTWHLLLQGANHVLLQLLTFNTPGVLGGDQE